MQNENPTDKKKQRLLLRFRFGLRTLFILVTILTLVGGFYLASIRKQKEAVKILQSHGGSVGYDFHFRAGYSDRHALSTVPLWLLDLFGVDAFHQVVEVNMNFRIEDNAVKLNTKHVAESWLALPQLPHIRHLNMDYGNCTEDSFSNIRYLKELESIQISDVHLGDAAIKHLENLTSLQTVVIRNAGLTDESLKILAKLPKLQKLAVDGNAFTNDGLAEIANSRSLTELFIGGKQCTINDDGIPLLAKLKRLKEIELRHTQISNTGLQHFDAMKSVKILRVGNTNVTWKGADQFKKTKRPDVVFQGGGLR